MIKKELILSLLIFSFALLFAQSPESQETQTLSPREVFVGDTAEISYTFNSAITFPLGETSSAALDFSEDILPLETETYTIKSATLSLIGNQYKLSVLFIQWQTGIVDIPSFDLMTVFNKDSSGFVIDLAPVMIASIIDKTGKDSLRPPSPPILIPGTTYAIYAIAVLSIVFLILLIRTLFNIDGLINFWQKVFLYFGYGHNARVALKAINNLRKKVEKFDDVEFSDKLQLILRNYLGYRFSEDFYSITTNKIALYFSEFTQDTMSFSLSMSVEDLSNIFRRLDYVRYAQNSIDSKRLPQSTYSTVLDQEERFQILSKANDVIVNFESPEKEESKPELKTAEEKND